MDSRVKPENDDGGGAVQTGWGETDLRGTVLWTPAVASHALVIPDLIRDPSRVQALWTPDQVRDDG